MIELVLILLLLLVLGVYFLIRGIVDKLALAIGIFLVLL
jgi:hypothetical protein